MMNRELATSSVLALANAGRLKDALSAWQDNASVLEADADGQLLRSRLEAALGLRDEAYASARKCVALMDNHLPGWLAVADLAWERDHRLAAGASLRAVRIAENIDIRQIPPDYRRALSLASHRMRGALLDQLEQALVEVEATHGREATTRLRKGARMFAGMDPLAFAHPLWRPGLFYIPDLPPVMFFEGSDFDWAADAEAATPLVREEFLALHTDDSDSFRPYLQHDESSPEARVWKGLNNSMKWSSRHFYRHGKRIAATHEQCPQTSALLSRLDLQAIEGYGPECMFSVLQPHSRIPAHYGSVNGRLIVHLPLIVPPDCGGIRVGTETRTWHEGRILVFDDSFEHEAWNHSDAVRAVLIFDTWNPHLAPAERVAVDAVLRAAQGFEAEMLATSA